MSLLKDALEAKKFDIRVIEKNKSRGVISLKEVEAHRKTIKDEEPLGEWVNLEELAQQEVEPVNNAYTYDYNAHTNGLGSRSESYSEY